MPIRLSALLGLLLPTLLFAAGPPMEAFLTAAQRQRLAEQVGLFEKATFAERYGGPREVADCQNAALQIDRDLFGEVRRQNAEALSSLAYTLIDADDLPAARRVKQEILDVARRRFGPENWRVTDARFELQLVDRLQDAERRRKWKECVGLHSERERLIGESRFREALQLSRRIASQLREVVGENHPDYASALQAVAILLTQLDDPAAELYFLRAVGIREAAQGKRHPESLEALCNLARLYVERGTPRRAIGCLRAASPLDLSETQDPLTLIRRVRILAQVASAAEDFNAARHMLEYVAVHMPKEAHATEDFIGLVAELAGIYMRQGRYNEAWKLMTQVEEMAPTVLPAGSTSLLRIEAFLAGLCARKGEYRDAKQRTLKVLEKAKVLHGERSSEVAYHLSGLGVLHDQMGERAEAMAVQKQALALFESLPGAGLPPVADCLVEIAELHHDAGNDAAALPLARRAQAIIRDHVGEQHLDYANCLRVVALIREKEPVTAWPMLQQALAICKNRLGEAHPSFARLLSHESRLLRGMGHPREALRSAARAAQITRARLGEAHPAHARALRELGAARAALGDREGGKELRERADAIERAAGIVGAL